MMKKLIVWTGIFVSVVLLAGCASTPKETDVSIYTAPMKEGEMVEVATQVLDGRPGIIKNEPDMLNPVIESAIKGTYIMASYLPQVNKTLRQNGFVPVLYRPALTRWLTLQVDSLHYTEKIHSLFSGGKVSGSLKVSAANGEKLFSHTYSGEVTIGFGFGKRTAQVHQAVQRLLDNLFKDALNNRQLMQFLGK